MKYSDFDVPLGSLNQLQRQRELERVAKENKELLKRLEKVEPMYKVSDWIDDWQKNAELMELITSYPEDTIDPLARSERVNCFIYIYGYSGTIK